MRIFSSGFSADVDGPGQRLVIYLKGCNLRCRWCANPESLSPAIQMAFYPGRSRTRLEYLCPKGAIDGETLQRATCATCADRACVSRWHSRCLEQLGQDLTVSELLQLCSQRQAFLTDGGVTFGGGEPSLQAEEVLEAARALRQTGLHTAMETNASTEAVLRLSAYIDLMICDFKCFSPERHLAWTGIRNDVIHANLRTLAAQGRELWVRTVLVEGFNTDAGERQSMSAFLSELQTTNPRLRVQILRMHHLGGPKYRALALPYTMEGTPEPSLELSQDFVKQLQQAGITACCA